MLGRCGKSFSSREVAQVESLLPGLGVARAAFGLPAPALKRTPPKTWLQGIKAGPTLRHLATVHTPTDTLIVRDRAGFREMVARRGDSELLWTRASLSDASQSGWPYLDLFHLAPALSQQKQKVLFIGCGGGVSVHQFARHYPGISIDLVEHEPKVIELARTWFALNSIPNLKIHIQDGADFIRHAPPTSWDIILIDAYDAVRCNTAFSEPSFLRAARQALEPGGALACNLIGTLANTGPVSGFVSSARRLFKDVRILPVVDPNESFTANALRNIVVIATRGDRSANIASKTR
jgi:spermidine synthase